MNEQFHINPKYKVLTGGEIVTCRRTRRKILVHEHSLCGEVTGKYMDTGVGFKGTSYLEYQPLFTNEHVELQIKYGLETGSILYDL